MAATHGAPAGAALDAALFFVLGVGTLFPWNAFITEASYFQARFRGEAFEDTFESAFGIAYNISNLVALLALLGLQQFLAERTLVVAPYVLTGAIFAAMAGLASVEVSSASFLFVLTLGCVVAAGLLAAPMIAGVTGLASRFPRDCASSFFSGQAFAGVVASLTSLVTTASAPQKSDVCPTPPPPSASFGPRRHNDDEPFKADISAVSYFAVASAVCLLCVAAYAAVKARQSARERKRGPGALLEPFIGDEGNTLGASNPFEELAAPALPRNVGPSRLDETDSSEEADADDGDTLLDVDELHRRELNRLPTHEAWDLRTIKLVARLTLHPCAAVLLTFWVTLSVFPAVTAVTESTRKCAEGTTRFWNDLFVPVLFLLFNAFDLVGRVVQARWQPFSGRQLLHVALARVVFLPMFWVMRVKDSRLPILFDNDALPIVVSALCGFSNGFVGTASMVHASRLVPPVHRDLAATISVTALTVGLGLGSGSSFGTMWIIQGAGA